MPALDALRGVGTDTAASLLVAVGGNPERLKSEASFARLCGVAPVPASSGKRRCATASTVEVTETPTGRCTGWRSGG
jgi:transposase